MEGSPEIRVQEIHVVGVYIVIWIVLHDTIIYKLDVHTYGASVRTFCVKPIHYVIIVFYLQRHRREVGTYHRSPCEKFERFLGQEKARRLLHLGTRTNSK